MTNRHEALVLALQLAITASSDDKAQECIEHAEQLAYGMDELDVERAKKQALETA